MEVLHVRLGSKVYDDHDKKLLIEAISQRTTTSQGSYTYMVQIRAFIK